MNTSGRAWPPRPPSPEACSCGHAVTRLIDPHSASVLHGAPPTLALAPCTLVSNWLPPFGCELLRAQTVSAAVTTTWLA